jgi:peroxiredoxin
VYGISVDTPEQNRAMIEKLILPFSLLADPEGAVIRSYGVWDEEGQIARPAIFVVGHGGIVRYAYVGEDFADRVGDEPVLEALRVAGGPDEG